MAGRSTLRLAGRGVLTVALVLTVTKLLGEAPAYADTTVILESPPVTLGGGGNVLIVSTPDLDIQGSLTVDNPGSTVPTGQQCSDVSQQYGSFCLGSADDLANVHIGPVDLDNVEGSPYRLPGHAMDWIVDEAAAFVAASHGVENDDLVRAYARPEIRAYVLTRLESIVNKKLYGEPMDAQELGAYAEIEALYKDKLVQDSKWALEEYDKWTRNPCTYVAPAPPNSKFTAVPNEAQESTACSAAGARFSIWTFTNNTPAADTFDTWASYRHPSLAMRNMPNAKYQWALSATYGAVALTAGYGLALGVGALTTLALLGAPAAITSIAIALGWGIPGLFGVTLGISALAVALTVAGLVFLVVAALATLGVAIWRLVEDLKPGADLRDRAARVAADNDPLGMLTAIPNYAALDFAAHEDPADESQLALIHQTAFHQQLLTYVNDWMMFRPDGTLIPDPTTGYNPAGTTLASDVHFVEGGTPKNVISVRAPAGTVNDQGQALSGYNVTFSRGFLMVADLVTGEQAFRPYTPRMSLRYLDDLGRTGLMSVVRVGHVDGPPTRQFLLATLEDPLAEELDYVASDSWTFDPGAGQPARTVTLIDELPLTPAVNVIPSVDGEMVATHFLKLSANRSTPGDGTTGGQFTWSVERLDELGNVVGTPFNPGGNFSSFTHQFDEPGDYRAKVTYTWTGPTAGTASGRVDFTVGRPAAQVDVAEVQDDRVTDGSLTLNLVMSQNTAGDDPGDPAEFGVDVEWADDGLGNTVSQHYDVRCADTGFGTCETGQLFDQPSGGPTNAQWSESPTFNVDDDQNYLPYVKVTITNSFGEVISRIYEITGEHRPTYATMTPYVEMPAGVASEVDVVQVFPSDLLPGSKNLQINPYVLEMVEHLPPGVFPDIVQKPNDEWWLQLQGVPTADDIGQWTFYFPFEQETTDNPRRPAPALTTLEVVSSTTPGYRAIIRGVPQDVADRSYRTDYPDWTVQVAQRLDDGEEFADFTGTVMCKLEAGPNLVFDKQCAQNAPFPWPDELISDSMFASVRAEPGGQPVSGDGAYEALLFTSFLEPTVTVDPVGPSDANVTVRLHLEDNAEVPRVVSAPFSGKGFTVSCSLDGAAYAPCLDSGVSTFAKTPLGHTLDVKVVAPDSATVVRRVTWDGGPAPQPPPLPPSAKQLSAALTAVPAKADALKARFDLAVGYGGAVAPPYAAKGFTATCVMDGAKAVPCFDSGSLELLRVPGKHHLAVTVKATDGQALTKQLAWSVATPKTTFVVKVPTTAEAGTKIKVKASGLLPHEKFVVKVAGEKVAKGEANDRGRVVRKVKLDGSLDAGKVKVVVRGATRKRTGKDVVAVAVAHARAPDPRVARILV